MDQITPGVVEEFKERMHITHSSEDKSLERLLSFSVAAIQRMCGEFDIEEDEMAKELVFERTRYAYNDSLEFFEDNFLSEITALGLEMLPDTEEGDTA